MHSFFLTKTYCSIFHFSATYRILLPSYDQGRILPQRHICAIQCCLPESLLYTLFLKVSQKSSLFCLFLWTNTIFHASGVTLCTETHLCCSALLLAAPAVRPGCSTPPSMELLPRPVVLHWHYMSGWSRVTTYQSQLWCISNTFCKRFWRRGKNESQAAPQMGMCGGWERRSTKAGCLEEGVLQREGPGKQDQRVTWDGTY